MSRQMWAIAAFFLFSLAGGAGAVVVLIDHLAPPPAYDNAGTIPFGQTFVATASNMAGMVSVIGDPNNPTGGTATLDGPARLVLFDATNPAAPIALGTSAILGPGESISGQVDRASSV